MSTKDDIKAEAFSLGFSLFGISDVCKPSHFSVYENWITNGHHANMAYLASSRALLHRSEPALILPEAKSIIILGLNYPHPNEMQYDHFIGPVGKISSYACVNDYHDVIPQLLQKLVKRIEAIMEKNIRSRIYTDTGPILERELSQMAGLGWVGKSSCLITPNIGSFFFIAELFCDQEYDFDTPFSADRCGKCQRCIEACPTEAILPNRTIDENKCRI